MRLRTGLRRPVSDTVAPAALQGAAFGVLMAAQSLYDGRRWTEVVPVTAVVATVFAAIMWSVAERNQRRVLQRIFPGLTTDQRRAVRCAAVRGAAPADPQVRSAAVAFVRYRLALSRHHRTPLTVFLVVLLLASLGATIAATAWWLAGTAVLAVLFVWMWVVPTRLSRRLELLASARPRPAPA